MSTKNTYTLADLKSATEKKLGPTVLVLGDDDEVTLPSVFRLGKTTREAVIKALEELDELGDIGEGDDAADEAAAATMLIDSISEILRLITPDAERLLAAVKSDDPLVTATILGDVLGKWMANTQAGEA